MEVTSATTSRFANKAVVINANCLDVTIEDDEWRSATHNIAMSDFWVDSPPIEPVSDGTIPLNGIDAPSHSWDRNSLHRISLVGVRDVVAVVILSFLVISAFICSCLRK